MTQLSNILQEILLKEYTEKTINDTIARWGIDPNDKTTINTARQLIQQFDQKKSSLAQKLDIVVLPDELKQNNNYLDINKYSYDDMVNLLKSLPQNEEKIKKEAIKKFVDKEQIDKATAQSYVARFMNKKKDLKYAVENGTEDERFTKEEVKKFIPAILLAKDSYLDPRNYRWQSLEQMLDALFPTQVKVGEEGENLAETDADKIYSKGDIEVYKCDEVHKCIQYNPTVTTTSRKKYGWCVAQPGNTNYDFYRFQETSPTFYFIFDRSKTSTPEHSRFDDPYHAMALQVNADGESYVVTNADNAGDRKAATWDDISKIVPPDTWAKIKNLKELFKPVALSGSERARKFAQGKNLTADEFKELSQDEKIMYVQAKATKNKLTQDILSILPKYKISLEGRTTTLANVAIDSGQKFNYAELKDYPSLASRYAIFRFRHTDYSKTPIPLPFIQYLDEPAKEKYMDAYVSVLSLELVEKYFGEKSTKEFVKKKLKNLDYLPPSAIKYIDNDKLKQLFSVYNKLFVNWKFGENLNPDEEKMATFYDSPNQDVDPAPILAKQWAKLSPQERKTLLDLANKVNGENKYLTLLYGLPFFIKSGGSYYTLLPVSETDGRYTDWVLLDQNDKVVQSNIDGDESFINDESISGGYFSDDTKPRRVYDAGEVTLNGEPASGILKEEVDRLKELAGIHEYNINKPAPIVLYSLYPNSNDLDVIIENKYASDDLISKFGENKYEYFNWRVSWDEDDNRKIIGIRIFLLAPSFGGGGDPEEIDDAFDYYDKEVELSKKILTKYSYKVEDYGDSCGFYIDKSKVSNFNQIAGKLA
jgi:hypothetical protein